MGVAQAIGEVLGARGFAVDVKPFLEDPDPSAYQAVLMGSAVNGAQWLPEALILYRALVRFFKSSSAGIVLCAHHEFG